MSSVAAILRQMAENAGRAQRERGAMIAGTVAGAAQVPANIIEDQRRDALLKRNQAIQDEQLGFQRNADARAQSDQTMQTDAVKLATARATALKVGIAAGFAGDTDPKNFNETAAIKAVTDAGFPDLAPTISKTHQEMLPKLTERAPGSALSDPAGAIVPGSQVPFKPEAITEAQLDQQAQNILAKPEEQRTPEEIAQLGAYQQRKDGDSLITVKTMVDGKPVEKVMKKADALKQGVFPSQPSASVQINQAAAASAGQPASAAEKAIANYMLPPVSPRSMQTPAGKAMMDRILTENPSYDASQFSVRAPTRKAFTTGTQGQQITAMNTAIEHLDQLQAAADALKNGEFKPGNAAYNAIREMFGSNAPTNYDTIKNMVDKEVEAVANKGVPTVSGTAEQKALAGKSAGPDQIKGYIDTLIPLMGSKLNALHYQYKQAMGENDPFHALTPEAEAILAKRGKSKSGPATGDTITVGGFTVKVKK